MSCSRQSAILRLIAVWCESVIADESYAYRVTLADVLSQENVDLVACQDSLKEYDVDVRLQTLADEERQHRLVSAWMEPDPGARQ
jgi:hypothetical protein